MSLHTPQSRAELAIQAAVIQSLEMVRPDGLCAVMAEILRRLTPDEQRTLDATLNPGLIAAIPQEIRQTIVRAVQGPRTTRTSEGGIETSPPISTTSYDASAPVQDVPFNMLFEITRWEVTTCDLYVPIRNFNFFNSSTRSSFMGETIAGAENWSCFMEGLVINFNLVHKYGQIVAHVTDLSHDFESWSRYSHQSVLKAIPLLEQSWGTYEAVLDNGKRGKQRRAVELRYKDGSSY